jgi:DnaJ-class molecular chaperone
MNVRELIEDAMRGVRIVICGRCNGLGEIGEPTLRATCPDCRGCGETTINELEVNNEAES